MRRDWLKKDREGLNMATTNQKKWKDFKTSKITKKINHNLRFFDNQKMKFSFSLKNWHWQENIVPSDLTTTILKVDIFSYLTHETSLWSLEIYNKPILKSHHKKWILGVFTFKIKTFSSSCWEHLISPTAFLNEEFFKRPGGDQKNPLKKISIKEKKQNCLLERKSCLRAD
jgi:hypothetical protein